MPDEKITIQYEFHRPACSCVITVVGDSDENHFLVHLMNSELSAAAAQWLSWDPNPVTRSEIQSLVDAENGAQLKKLLGSRMLFGTAGLRARMGAGYTCMNVLTVLQTTQGLVAYLKQHCSPSDLSEKGVVLGYDGRHNSREFAEAAAVVFLQAGVRVHLFRRLACTPMVPFTCKALDLCAGVMVTASHNPKDDNGYKLYWSNAAQIIPPHDANIQAEIEKNLKPWLEASAYTSLDLSHPLLSDPTSAMTELYMQQAASFGCWHRETNSASALKIAYTAMHGVGLYWTEMAFQRFNLPPFVQVAEQVQPDADFPTVAFPNPEEGKGALALAVRTADANGCAVILANDPDADRLAVAEHQPASNGTEAHWRFFNGNEIAALLADWAWSNHCRTSGSTLDKSNCFMLASTVSSKFLASMAAKEGFKFVDTLTGFKWMGNVAQSMEQNEHKHFLFAYEVEIGFLVGNLSYDKDGVRTAAMFAEMASQIYASGSNLAQHLESLYKKYGYFVMNTSYFFSYNAANTDRLCTRLRTGAPDGGYLKRCGKFDVVRIRDATLGTDSGEADGISRLPRTPDAQMITYWFSNGATATLRNSGTEPKLKYYVEASDSESREQAAHIVAELTSAFIADFMQPEINELVPPKRD